MLAKDMALWATVRADYLATGMSYKQLAEKHNVSISTLKKKAMKEHWTRAREKVIAQAGTDDGTGTGSEPGTEITVLDIERGVQERRDRMQRFMEASDAMMDRIVDALTSPEVISPYSLKLLASALRDLREMQGLNKSALDIEEQQARIEKLRSEIKTGETPEDRTVVVEFVDSYGMEA